MDNNQTNNMTQEVNTQTNENLNQEQPVETAVEPVQELNQVSEQTEHQQQEMPVAQQPQQMYQQQMPIAPRKKFNWFLWIAVALIIPIAMGVILHLIGNSIGGSAEMQPIANFIYSLGTLAMWLLTFPSLLIVIIIGVTRGNKN